MRLDNLRLRGFRGIKVGMGLDEIELDLSGLTGLVALAGNNGKGKTTILENMHPFRVMPSKKSSLYRQTFLRDSQKDLSFWFEGSHYRTLVKIDAQGEKSEGYIWKDHNEKSEVDGKVTNYDPYLIELLGSQNLFFNSSFSAQKSKKISELTTGKLQGLFSEFLRLYKLIAHESTSKQCITVIGTIAARINEEIKALEIKMMGKEETKQELLEAEEKNDAYSKSRIELVEKIRNTEISYETAKDAIVKSVVKKERLKDLEQNLVRFKGERDREVESAETGLTRLRIKLREINEKTTAGELLLKDKDKITEACQREDKVVELIPAVEKDIEFRKKELDRKDSETDRINKDIDKQKRVVDAGKKDPEIIRLETEISGRSAIDVGKKDPEVARLEAEISGKREKTDDFKKRDPKCKTEFGPEDEICSFIIRAIEAKRELPLLEKQLSDRRDVVVLENDKKAAELESLKKQLSDRRNIVLEDDNKATAELESLNSQLSVALNEREDDRKKHNELKEEKERLDNDLKEARLLSVKKPDLAVVMSQKDDLEKRKGEVTLEGTQIRDARDGSISRIDDDVKKLNVEIDGLKDLVDDSLNENKSKIETQINELKAELENIDNSTIDTREKIAVLKQSIAEKRVAEKDIIIESREHLRLTNEQSEWIYLRNSCGKDGLRQLELDCVAPIISGHANDLLSMSFGSNDLIKFLTQDEEGREDVKIIILRKEGEVLLDDLCGGEEVVTLKALKLAMTLISQEKSGKRYETIFCDEEDGALSVENAVKFIYLYKSLMKIAEMDTCFYISHKKECVALADHMLDFREGGIVTNPLSY